MQWEKGGHRYKVHIYVKIQERQKCNLVMMAVASPNN
jgi:hypothetical protein